MARINLLLFYLISLITLVSAGSSPTFCKCTCFKNSTLIILDEPAESNNHADLAFAGLRSLVSPDYATVNESPRAVSGLCAECTKAFCLGQELDICEKAKESDVATQCFKRDSIKDRLIVWGFLIGTLGLLGWAAIRRLMAWRQQRAANRNSMNYGHIPQR
ncbi:unnamed protein product [Clonostachys chloroleuca]|uniref:Uncharacterized protein n=1 Tax=Clonostachys chloroleuca TaxID=1926264 RepID=A0AA35QEM8_9HYPO|nr:unnamed protein product [Clonostachys chloroleuca]